MAVAAAAMLSINGEPSQAQQGAEPTTAPTQTPTPERREGYEGRLAARIARYQAARDEPQGAYPGRGRQG